MDKTIRILATVCLYLFLLMGAVGLFAAATQINLATQAGGILGTANGGTGVATAAAGSAFGGPLAGAAAAPSFKSIGALGPAIQLPSIRKWEIAWQTNTTATNSGIALRQNCNGTFNAATSTVPMFLSFATGAVSGNATTCNEAQATYRFDSSPYYEIRAGMSSTSNVRFWILLSNDVTASYGANDDIQQDHFGIRYSTSAGDTHYQCVTNNNSATSNFVDSGVTPNSNMDLFQFYYDQPGGAVYVWINGVAVCTNPITSQLPSGTAQATFVMAITTLTNSAVSRKINFLMQSGNI